jgi:hypothetical protein
MSLSINDWLVPTVNPEGEPSDKGSASNQQGSDWFIGRDRAMISLGPVGRKHCTYSCAFCYVQGSFPKYPAAPIDTIMRWLRDNSEHFSIVYVSGDTDSFARPRTTRGIELLSALVELRKDVLFTTRAVFPLADRARIEEIAKSYAAQQRLLVGCVSISQLHHPKLEPPPIPSIEERIDQLAWLKSTGIVSVLTIRPLIPMIPSSEYVEIAARTGSAADLIIGGDWYVDDEGVVSRHTTAAMNAVQLPEADGLGPLYFSTSSEPAWLTYRHHEAESALQEYSRTSGIPFFMGSEAAVRAIRHHQVRVARAL